MSRNWMRATAFAAIFAAGCAATAGARDGAAPAAAPGMAGGAVPGPHDRPGFTTREANGRVWVFRKGAKELEEFETRGEPTVATTRIGVGPGGKTLRAPDAETLDLYQASREGFEVRGANGRVWVFLQGDRGVAEFDARGEPTIAVSRIGAGPGGVTLRAPDVDTLNLYEAARSGWGVRLVNGRIWVFRIDDPALVAFDEKGEPTIAFTRVGAGPGGLTLRAPDSDTMDLYQASRPGFAARLAGERIWIFREGAKEAREFDARGEPTVSVARVGAGPGGRTLRAPDLETLDAWAAAR